MNRIVVAFLAAAGASLVLGVSAASAHHSFSAAFDLTAPVTVK